MAHSIDYDKVADLYDSYVRFEKDIPFFLEEARRAAGPVLELMSGTGRVSIPLVEAGIDLTCVDRSPGMLEVLRRRLAVRGLNSTLVTQDVRDLKLPSTYPLAFMPFHSFSELVDPGDRRRAIVAIRECLSPGGRFTCTLHNPVVRLASIRPGPVTLGRFPQRDGEGEVEVVADFSFEPGTSTVSGIQTVRRLGADGLLAEERCLPVRFVLLEAEDFESLSRGAGFEIEAIHGDYDRSRFDSGASPYMIFSMRRSTEVGR